MSDHIPAIVPAIVAAKGNSNPIVVFHSKCRRSLESVGDKVPSPGEPFTVWSAKGTPIFLKID